VVTVSDEQIRAYVASTRLDPYCPGGRRFLGVADANAVLSCVGNDCRKGAHWRSGLLRMTVGGAATLYASDHVYGEIYEHLPNISGWSKVPVNVLRERFEANYLPALRFVTVDASEITDPQVLMITDPDDVPSGQLAKLIAPCVVFSEDRHLRKPGLAPEEWRAIAEFGVDLIRSRGEALQLAARRSHRIHADTDRDRPGEVPRPSQRLVAVAHRRSCCWNHRVPLEEARTAGGGR
jgi:hypothetical protein